MKTTRLLICLIALFVVTRESWATDYTGIWKDKCSNYYGIQIKYIEKKLYSVSFCGLDGCFKPGEWTPNTRIEGDPEYKIISPTELGIKKCKDKDEFFIYKKCADDPTWIVVEPKRTPPVPCHTIGNTHSNEFNDTTLISLLVVKEDLLKNKVHDEILLIGKYSHGKYDVVSRWDNTKEVEISERKDLLQAHNKYTVYQNGYAIKESVVNKICQAMYDCSAIDIGCSKTTSLTKAKKEKGRLQKEYEGFNDGVDFKEKTFSFVALNSDSAAVRKQKATITIKKTPKSVIVKISEYVKKKILEDQPNLNSKNVKFSQVLAFNLMGDNSVQYVVEVKAENEKTKLSGIYIVQLKGRNIKELFSVKDSNDPDSWGNGYSFLDALDIDGDGIPELIFEVRGYESTGYQIYHLEKDGYKKVFEDTTSGC